MKTIQQMLKDIHGESGDGFVSCPAQAKSGRTLRELGRTLVKVHSWYTRLVRADDNGMVKCFTCQTWLPWTQAQEGHFIPRSKLGTKFLDMNTHPQCPVCNVVKRGNLLVYAIRLDERYGNGTAFKLAAIARDHRCEPPSRADLVEAISKYKALVKIEKKRLGIIK